MVIFALLGVNLISAMLVIELGVALDILIAAFIFGIFFFQIRTTFETLDLKAMEKLKEEE